MANRFPLIVDSSTKQVKELPANDNLDLTSSGIVGVTSIGIGTDVPTASLEVNGNLNGVAFESYELDDVSSAVDGLSSIFIPTFNYERVNITNPFNLLITINGIQQSAFINSTNYVYQSNFLGSNSGFTIDFDNNIKFTESVPIGSQIVIRLFPASVTSRIRYYPFNPADILLGY